MRRCAGFCVSVQSYGVPQPFWSVPLGPVPSMPQRLQTKLHSSNQQQQQQQRQQKLSQRRHSRSPEGLRRLQQGNRPKQQQQQQQQHRHPLYHGLPRAHLRKPAAHATRGHTVGEARHTLPALTAHHELKEPVGPSKDRWIRVGGFVEPCLWGREREADGVCVRWGGGSCCKLNSTSYLGDRGAALSKSIPSCFPVCLGPLS